MENKQIIIKCDLNKDASDILMDYIAEIINERTCGEQYEEAELGFKQATAEPLTESKKESGFLMG